MYRFGAIIGMVLASIAYSGACAFGEVIGTSFVFVQDSKPTATLVIGSKTDLQDDVHFADIIAKTVASISAVEVPVADSKDKVHSSRQVLIGTPEGIPLVKKLLAEDAAYQDEVGNAQSNALLPAELGEQGFIIHRTQQGDRQYLILTGHTPLGVLYAVNTLQDRLHLEAGEVIVDGFGTRLMPIVNTPAFTNRSLQTAVGGPDFLGSGQYMREFGYDYQGFVDWLASHKINNILLHDTGFTWGICYDSKRFPELVNRDHPNVEKDYLGGIIKYGRKRGLTVFFAHNMPDRCDFIVKARPELAGINKDGSPKPGTFCLNKPEVLELWKAYWDETLTHYPDVEAIGCQFGEHLNARCQCDVCGCDKYFERQLAFFDAMVDVAQSKNPPVKYWIWRVPGAKQIIENKRDYPDLVDIDWRLKFRPFMLGHETEGDWYLYHHHGNNPEFGIKQVSMALQKQHLKGMQIRAVQFKEKDRMYQCYEEFTWNPKLSIEDYAHLYTIKTLRRKNKNVTKAYVHYMRARGYYEIFRADNRRRRQQDWDLTYDKKFKEELVALKETLKRISIENDFVDWLRSQAEIPAIAHEMRTHLVNIVNSDGSCTQIEVIRPEGGGCIGPMGENYGGLASSEQLREVYGY